MISFEMSEEIREQKEYAEKVSREKIRPHARHYDEHEHEVPWDFVKFIWDEARYRIGCLMPGSMDLEEPFITQMHSVEALAWGDQGFYLALQGFFPQGWKKVSLIRQAPFPAIPVPAEFPLRGDAVQKGADEPEILDGGHGGNPEITADAGKVIGKVLPVMNVRNLRLYLFQHMPYPYLYDRLVGDKRLVGTFPSDIDPVDMAFIERFFLGKIRVTGSDDMHFMPPVSLEPGQLIYV